jgi:putative Flp pilus-assembly TadE/G-like protein
MKTTSSAGHLKQDRSPRSRDDDASGDKTRPNCHEMGWASWAWFRAKFLTHRPKGQAMIIIILALPALVAALAFGCDMAVMYANHVNLQRAADAAVVSGGG